MNNFTVKVKSEYPTTYTKDGGKTGETLRTTRNQLFSAEKVDIQRLKEECIVSLDDNKLLFSVPYHIDVNDWKDGITTAIYVENAQGKTTEIIRGHRLGEDN